MKAITNPLNTRLTKAARDPELNPTRRPEYGVWNSMIQRCQNPSCRGFPWYGGRGITVSDSWRNSFLKFYEDMGPRPSSSHSIDRINNDGNYEAGNVRWATRFEQARNKRRNKRLTLNGTTLCETDWAARTGLPRSTIRRRLKRGWSDEKSLLTPYGQRGDFRGSKSGQSILDEAAVLIIKRRITDGDSCASIARSFGVSSSTIVAIKTGQNWSWLKPGSSTCERAPASEASSLQWRARTVDAAHERCRQS